MLVRPILFLALSLVITAAVMAQSGPQRAPASAPRTSGAWQPPGDSVRSEPRDEAGPEVRTVSNDRGIAAAGRAVVDGVRKQIAKVKAGTGNLPADAGQVWREYDISPYTLRVTSTNRPEQAVIDWVLRETGYEAWHSDPVGLLSADHRSLKVYHTPEMHEIVSEIVDRFVNSEAESQAFGLRVITVESPNWRSVAHRMMMAVPVQTQGVQAWLLEKENASLLLAELRKRNDFREHSSPHLLVNNGQSAVVSATRPLSYIRDVVVRPGTWPGFETESAVIDEGFSIELSPLLSIDGGTIDAILKCNIDQVERLQSVNLDVPTTVSPRQRTKIEVPQVSHCRLHERFHWPINQVLLVSLGVVATPTPVDRNPNLVQMALAMPPSPPRADLLVLVEHKGRSHLPQPAAAPAATAGVQGERTGRVQGRSYGNRY
jgi:hypothetical protein